MQECLLLQVRYMRILFLISFLLYDKLTKYCLDSVFFLVSFSSSTGDSPS
uniref:Uncharacterized protein n=1 Tax=Rhizophora mucronata TaxID=61149 RepID=A0A2P2NBZ0_RHIMU